jgi:hypothetical protein
MRRFLVLATAALLIALPGWAAARVTVGELDSLLAEMHTQNKGDDATANKLKELVLVEQLTEPVMNSFARYEPGPETIVQIHVLALESALLPPPGTDLPTTPAPDQATQKAIMSRAIDYVAQDFTHLPRFTADKSTARYQNGEDYVRTSTGAGSQMAHSDLGLNPANQYMRYLGEHSTPIAVEGGIELARAKAKGADPASQNGQISQGGPGPVLAVVLMDASKGLVSWLRWQTVGGKQTAVFGFAVDRKHSHYQVNYCCFPKSEDVGSHIGASPGGVATGPGGGQPSAANYGVSTSFETFKTTPGYHGELFIDPETGAIVRLTLQAELKPTDFVQQEDTRVDYAPVEIAGKHYFVPFGSRIPTTVVPSGQSYQKVATRRTLFDIKYSNYQPAAA